MGLSDSRDRGYALHVKAERQVPDFSHVLAISRELWNQLMEVVVNQLVQQDVGSATTREKDEYALIARAMVDGFYKQVIKCYRESLTGNNLDVITMMERHLPGISGVEQLSEQYARAVMLTLAGISGYADVVRAKSSGSVGEETV